MTEIGQVSAAQALCQHALGEAAAKALHADLKETGSRFSDWRMSRGKIPLPTIRTEINGRQLDLYWDGFEMVIVHGHPEVKIIELRDGHEYWHPDAMLWEALAALLLPNPDTFIHRQGCISIWVSSETDPSLLSPLGLRLQKRLKSEGRSTQLGHVLPELDDERDSFEDNENESDGYDGEEDEAEDT
jgi:hypothetical protein